MALTLEQVKVNDYRFIYDFYSLGAWAHQYTATALYHEAQRIPDDHNIALEDKPRIQMVLRAKIFAEAVASMETIGKLLFAIKSRRTDGIASQFVNGSESHSERGLRMFHSTNSTVSELLHLPTADELQSLNSGEDVGDFMERLKRVMEGIFQAYLEPNSSGREMKSIVEAYRAIKHGNCLSVDPRTVSVVNVSVRQGHVWMITRWPRRNETMDKLNIKEIGLTEDQVINDMRICEQVATCMSNLCSVLIRLLEAGTLTY